MAASTKKTKKKKAAQSTSLPVGVTRVDKPRASKEGNRYHEAWLARRALELIFPRDGLAGIAVEGLYDEVGLGQEAIEIADATFYFGSIHFDQATAIRIEQFKYSIARGKDPFRASDASKTLAKFCKADRDMAAKYGRQSALSKVRYGLTTNRPIYSHLAEAVAAAASGLVPKNPSAKRQLEQIERATGLKGKALASFSRRLQFAGQGDTVTSIDGNTRRTITDWSASTDLHTKARMGSLRELISKKASIPGQYDKIIVKEDILAAFDVSDEKDLLPAPQAFPQVGPVVERGQLTDFLGKLNKHQLLLIHASGGVGKTVFAQSIASKLAEQDEVVLFDCFGGGDYRITTDARHRPERGLMHIVNELAARGVCDPILPGSNVPDVIVRTAIRRFSQSIEVLKRSRPQARLVILLDAMDNAGLQADMLQQPSFPRLLFEAYAHAGVPDRLLVIGTCRSERIKDAIGAVKCFNYSLEGFSIQEATEFIQARRPEATPDEIAAIYHRSEANPRVIATLIKPPRPLSSDDTSVANLDTLIQQQIDDAVDEARKKGAEEAAVNAFLCSLAWLPPPVPIAELAAAFGQPVSAIESFASDLAPLLDRTRHGLIFRDEPTETLVRNKYGKMTYLLTDVVRRLTLAQGTSAYAARSLPGLLFAIDDVGSLKELAFDERFPPELTSEIAKRSIRMNRLRVAVAAATRANDADAMTALLVELSSVAVVHERGDDYFLDNPDLVIALGDGEATRRLYESRRGWFGARPSRLAIAYLLDSGLGEAYEDAVQSVRWLQWLYSKREDDPRSIVPSLNDYAAWAFYVLEAGQFPRAVKYLEWWKSEYSFKIANRVVELDRQARILGSAKLKPNICRQFALRADCPAPYLAAFLEQYPSASNADRKKVIGRLAKKLKKYAKMIEKAFEYPERAEGYRESILKAACVAHALGLNSDARVLRAAVVVPRYRFYQIRERISPDDISGPILAIALDAAFAGREPTIFDCLPHELAELVAGISCPNSIDGQEKAVVVAIEAAAKQGPDPNIKPRVSSSEQREWTDRLHSKMIPLRMLACATYGLLQSKNAKERRKAVEAYFDSWEGARIFNRKQHYGMDRELGPIDQFYLTTYFHLMAAFDLCDARSAQLLFTRLKDVRFKPTYLLSSLVKRFSMNSATHTVAAELATEIVKDISLLDDTSERSSNYAELARAIFPADRAEAKELFAKGYNELNAIGSGDYELTNELLHFACKLGRAPLSPESAHTLAKIVELSTPYEAEKFSWPLAARAFAAAWGIDYLAQITRWDDRGKIGLDYTIGSAVTKFVELGAISSREGFALLSLVDPVEPYGWQIEDFLEVALAREPHDGATIAMEYLDLLERKYLRSVPERELAKFEEVVTNIDPTIMSGVSDRVSALRNRNWQEGRRRDEYSEFDPKLHRKRLKEEASELKQAKKLAASTKSISSEDLERLVAKLDEIHGRLELKTEAFRDVRTRLPYSDRQGFVRSIAEAKNLELSTKLSLLEEAKHDWLKQSPSGLGYFKGLGLRLVELHAQDLLGRDWGFVSQLNELVALSGDAKIDIAVHLARLAATKELRADAIAWLSLAQIISDSSKPDVPRDALTRILSSEAARLAVEVGDGHWKEGLAAPKDHAKVVAGIIWYMLASQSVTMRWVAAHTVRRLAKLDLWDVVGELFVLFSGTDGGAFQDRGLPFFQMHAQLWFLIAIARIALDHSEQIAPYRLQLLGVLRETNFPHPAMQDAAAKALKATYRDSPPPTDIADLIENTNKSPFPVSAEGRSEYPHQRPHDAPKEDFYIEYEFNKHDIAGVGRVFATPEWKTVDDMVEIVRRWDKNVKSMHDYQGKQQSHGDGYSRTSSEQFHSYGYYLGWHAIKVLAGINLRTRPVRQMHYESDTWADWLADVQLTRKDGLWPSDGTEPFPKVASKTLLSGTDKTAHPVCDPKILASLAGIVDGKFSEQLTIEGDWEAPDSVHVSISSVLVEPGKAQVAGVAVATSPIHCAWLPTFNYFDEQDYRESSRRTAPLEAWVASRDIWYRFDDDDPFMSKYVLKRSRLSEPLNKRFQLKPEPLWNKSWTAPGGKTVLRSSAWGSRNSYLENADWLSGHSLSVDAAFLREVLTATARDLLLLVNLRHSKDYDRYREMKDCDRYTQSTLVVLVNSNLEVRIVSPTAEEKKVIRKLGVQKNTEFEDRYKALVNANYAAENTRKGTARPS